MGQAKKRGSLEQRIAQARERHQSQGGEGTISLIPRAAPIDADYVLSFCSSVDGASTPIAVRSSPIPSQLDNCFPEVERKVAEAGGRLVLGWAIWEIPGFMLEAELHAVWQRPDGGYLDISPRPLPFDSITFLPDSKGLSYARQVDNIRQPLSADPRVLRFIALQAESFALLNDGELADQFAVNLPPASRRKLDLIEREQSEIYQSLKKVWL